MSEQGKSEEILKAEERLKKAKEKLRKAKYAESKRKRRERDTALFTIGACFAAMLDDEKLGPGAKNLWDSHMSKIAPQLITDSRRNALKNVFGLDAARPPSAD